MSQVYSTEPSTTGEVTLETSHGPIDIQLWCKECPHSCRLFLQLALDGYYDKLPFHRIMEDFLIQTGLQNHNDQNNLKYGKIDDYFNKLEKQNGIKLNPIETMSRIRFNHRGQVAMARSTTSASTNEEEEQNKVLNGQFFITLDSNTAHLNDKHIIFGKVVGPTIFNAMRIGRIETSEDGTPLDYDSCPTVKSITIKHHTFTDLVMSKTIPWKNETNNTNNNAGKQKKKKRKGKRDLNVLSFGNEEEEMAQIIYADSKQNNGKRIKSSHDVVRNENENSHFSQNADEQVTKIVFGNQHKKENASEVHKTNQTNNTNLPRQTSSQEKTKEYSNLTQTKNNNEDSNTKHSKSYQAPKHETPPIQHESYPTKMKSNSNKSEPNIYNKLDSKPDKTPKMSLVEARRAKYLKQQKVKKGTKNDKSKEIRDEQTMEKLLAFRNKVFKIKGSKQKGESSIQKKDSATSTNDFYHGQILEKDSDDESSNENNEWMKIKFKCKKHVDEKSMREERKGQNYDDYVVIDDNHSSNHHSHHRKGHSRRSKHHARGWNESGRS